MHNHNEDVLFAEERRVQITEYVNKNKKATVNELSEYFKVSIATVRNDLKDLETLGVLIRTHGGAMIKPRSSLEIDLTKRTDNILAKKNIAMEALKFIDDGDTLILDSGTTIHELAKLLSSKKDLTIITNDITCANILENNNFNIVLLGGVLSNNFHWTVGVYTLNMLKDLSADKFFMSAGGFSIDKGITVGTLQLAEVKRMMIKSSAQKILLCDSSKFEKYRLAKFADFDNIDIFITDYLDDKTLELIEGMNIEIVFANS